MDDNYLAESQERYDKKINKSWNDGILFGFMASSLIWGNIFFQTQDNLEKKIGTLSNSVSMISKIYQVQGNNEMLNPRYVIKFDHFSKVDIVNI